MKIIAHIRTDLPEKFGVPRQSGLAGNLKGIIIFEPEYRDISAFKGLEAFNYIWVLWQFEGTERGNWSPTVRPPRLGGNTQMGVFATRSPFRPNGIGLSSVKLEQVEISGEYGPLLHVSGIDMRDRTPIYDIKPYLKYADSHEDATDGFVGEYKNVRLKVEAERGILDWIPDEKRQGLVEILSQDPRPAYHDDPMREYGVSYAGYNVKFRVDADAGVVQVTQIERKQ